MHCNSDVAGAGAQPRVYARGPFFGYKIYKALLLENLINPESIMPKHGMNIKRIKH